MITLNQNLNRTCFGSGSRMNVAPELCQVFEDGDLDWKQRESGMLATDIRILVK